MYVTAYKLSWFPATLGLVPNVLECVGEICSPNRKVPTFFCGSVIILLGLHLFFFRLVPLGWHPGTGGENAISYAICIVPYGHTDLYRNYFLSISKHSPSEAASAVPSTLVADGCTAVFLWTAISIIP